MMKFFYNSLSFSQKAQDTLAWTVVVVVLGGIQAISASFVMNPDGVSYLNLGELYAKGEWGAAANGYWSPLYPLLLGLLQAVFQPSPYWEAPLVHALNFALYLASFASFRFFLHELQATQRLRKARSGNSVYLIEYTRPAEVICAYALFLWSALMLVGLENVTPDLLLSGILYAIGGLTLRLRSTNAAPAGFFAMGGLVALGYLTKAVMFPIGVLVLLTCGLGLGGARKVFLRTLGAFAGFFVVASPQIAAVSRSAGHLSYGENGALAYATYVNNIPRWWTGEPPGSGIPTHPIRVIHDSPAAYEFATNRIGSSYPYWDEPAYWDAGIRLHFDLGQQMRVIKPIVYLYLDLLGILLFAFGVLLLCRVRGPSPYFLRLVIPATGTFLLYALVYSEPRFLGVATVVLFLAMISSLAFPANLRRAIQAVLAVVALFKLAAVGNDTRYPLHQALSFLGSKPVSNPQLEIASGLRSLGVREGSRVASIGYAFDGYWARLAHVQIAMEIPLADTYWSAADSVKTTVQHRFASAGAVAIVANRVPATGPDPEWIPLGPSGYFALIIRNGSAVQVRDQ